MACMTCYFWTKWAVEGDLRGWLAFSVGRVDREGVRDDYDYDLDGGLERKL